MFREKTRAGDDKQINNRQPYWHTTKKLCKGEKDEKNKNK